MRVLAIFGPTAVGKTGVAVSVAELLRERGEDPAAISCDAIQVYRGLEVLSGAAGPGERERLEHKLLGVVTVNDEFSAGRFAQLAHREIDQLLEQERRPIVVGGTGLYLRAALSELDLRPPVPEQIRSEVESEMAAGGPETLHAQLDPDLAASIHPNDRKRIARTLELQRAGLEPPRTHSQGGRLWTADFRHPTLLVGLTIDADRLAARIGARVDGMVAGGVLEEVAEAERVGASRTARAAIGFEQLLAGDIEATKSAQSAYARRQLTWMRRMEGVRTIDRSDLSDTEVAAEIVSLL
ncbi:MAG: tRNA (adenosine(37)-N6)-dimethylallyltransferase MiaA [Solirubrobacterales bacterium]